MKITYKTGQIEHTTQAEGDAGLLVETKEVGGETRVIVTAQVTLELVCAFSELEHLFSAKDLVFANGYQSWTETKEFASGETLNDLNGVPSMIVDRFAFRAYGAQAFTTMEKSTRLSFDYAYIRGQNPLFIGSTNYKNAYLMIRMEPNQNRILLESDVFGKKLRQGERFTVFQYHLDQNIDLAMRAYFDRLTPRTVKKLFGYTSWYNHYQKIDESVIEKALEEADDRFDLFQIDDGFESAVGDWMKVDPLKFPNGLEPIVQKIHSRGMLAGIWLAPFAAEKRSELFRNHPDYIRRDATGKPILAGNNWGGFSPLNLDCPSALDYIRRSLRYYVNLGFDFFKLDFLYAANLSRMKGKTRAETSEFAYSLLQEELGGHFILGCGATLSNAYEKFHYMRVGPDVSLKFDDHAIMRLFHPERISTKVTLCNTIFRSPMNGHAFCNDPDVFLLRDNKLYLSKEQRYALTKINALFGSLLMTSDNPKTYDDEKNGILNKALSLLANAVVTDYARRGNFIDVHYEIFGHPHSFVYDIQKGVIRDER